MPRCPKCGYDLINNNGAYICNNCGSRFRAANSPAVQPQYNNTPAVATAPTAPVAPVETGKKGKKDKKDREGVNYGTLQFLAGFFLPLFGIIPGLLIGLATGYYGVNAKLFRGESGKLYAITKRTTALYIF